jgi:hypothetical protein
VTNRFLIARHTSGQGPLARRLPHLHASLAVCHAAVGRAYRRLRARYASGGAGHVTCRKVVTCSPACTPPRDGARPNCAANGSGAEVGQTRGPQVALKECDNAYPFTRNSCYTGISSILGHRTALLWSWVSGVRVPSLTPLKVPARRPGRGWRPGLFTSYCPFLGQEWGPGREAAHPGTA